MAEEGLSGYYGYQGRSLEEQERWVYRRRWDLRAKDTLLVFAALSPW